MHALIVVGTLAVFLPLFFGVMWAAGALAQNNRPALGWLTFILGLGGIISALVALGHAVQH